MIHLKALGIKFIAISIVVLSTFGLTNATTVPTMLLISFMMTVLTYLIGDLFILKTTGNIMATISDFGLMFVGLWLLGNIAVGTGQTVVALSLTAAFFISFVELFVHQMLIEQNEGNPETSQENWAPQLQTEFSEELDAGEKVDQQSDQTDDKG